MTVLMNKKTSKRRRTGCPITFGLDVFGDRWTLLVIREIMLKGNKTYSQFLEADEGIATNILIDRLKHLEAEGIITKTRDPDNRRSFIYALTAKGFDLAPIILAIVHWSGLHNHTDYALKGVLEKIGNNPAAYEAKIRAGHP